MEATLTLSSTEAVIFNGTLQPTKRQENVKTNSVCRLLTMAHWVSIPTWHNLQFEQNKSQKESRQLVAVAVFWASFVPMFTPVESQGDYSGDNKTESNL